MRVTATMGLWRDGEESELVIYGDASSNHASIECFEMDGKPYKGALTPEEILSALAAVENSYWEGN